MKRAVGQQLDQLKGKLNGYVALLMYRYSNLCIEADPSALLSITVEIDGEQRHIEDVAQVAIHEKYHFNIFPNYEDDFYAIGKGIEEVHPEFKQEIKTYEGYDDDDPEGKYIFCTMPEVNKEYHDALLKAVDTLYDVCQGQMDVAKEQCVVKLAVMMADASSEDQEKLSGIVDEIVKQYSDMRDSAHDTKAQEIEEAYAEYQQRQEEKKAKEQEKLQEQGNPLQMKLNPES